MGVRQEKKRKKSTDSNAHSDAPAHTPRRCPMEWQIYTHVVIHTHTHTHTHTSLSGLSEIGERTSLGEREGIERRFLSEEWRWSRRVCSLRVSVVMRKKMNYTDTQNQQKNQQTNKKTKKTLKWISKRWRWEIVELAWCVVLRVSASWVFVRLAQGSEGRRLGAQPSDTGGDTQPYFSWVFTRDLKVASASLRLKAFLDFPDFLHIRPCEEKTERGREMRLGLCWKYRSHQTGTITHWVIPSFLHFISFFLPSHMAVFAWPENHYHFKLKCFIYF